MPKKARRRNRRRIRFEQLEHRCLLAADQLYCALGDQAEGEGASENRWHNTELAADVNDDKYISPVDFLLVANFLNSRGTQALGEADQAASEAYWDVSNDQHVSPLDALLVANELNAEAEGLGGPNLTTDEVQAFLKRAAAASASQDAVIAIVDRGGRILGVRAEQGVLDEFDKPSNPTTMGNGNGTIDPGTAEERTLVFAIDGAVAKARTAAFFANGEFDKLEQKPVLGPLTSRTIRFVSQSTITQREVESNPSIPDPKSTIRGPGFVAPIGLGGHFPPEIFHTPPVDLFAIEHTNRDSVRHAGIDAILGTADDEELTARFDADFLPHQEVEAPESYGFTSERFLDARPRGIATLPGGIPLYRPDQDGVPTLVGGIGVFFPGKDGFATHEQDFVPGTNQSEFERNNAPKVLEAEWIAFAAACGAAGGGAAVGPLGGVACPAGYDLPFGRIDLVGVTLEVYGPNPTRERPQRGVDTLLQVGNNVGPGDPDSGADQIVTPGIFYREGKTVPKEWLVGPLDSPTGEISKDDVKMIIENAIDEANKVRAGIRLRIVNGQPVPGARTKMVFSVADRDGNVLGLYRMPDATFFSIDVAVAKARNTAYYADPDPTEGIQPADLVDDNDDGVADLPPGVSFTNRTFRFLAEARYPDGVENSRPGAFSILLDPGIDPETGENMGPALPASVYSTDAASVLGFDAFNPGRNFRDPENPDHQNGIVFFPGSSALYKDGKIVGGFGASGDGVDQDDVVTFSATVGFKPPDSLRADAFFVRDVRLPFQKFLRNPRA